MKSNTEWYFVDDLYELVRKARSQALWKQRIYQTMSCHIRELRQRGSGQPGRPRRPLVMDQAGVYQILSEAGIETWPPEYPIPYRLADEARQFMVRPGFYNATEASKVYPQVQLTAIDRGPVPTPRFITLLEKAGVYQLIEPDFLPLE